MGFAALGAPAQPADSTTNAVGTTHYSTTSGRSREAVRAELRNAQAAGELRGVGELADAPRMAVVPSAPEPVTRAQVRSELAQARAHHELRTGDLM